MVAKQQEINDPNTKHPGNEISNLAEDIVMKRVGIAVLVMIAVFVLLAVLGAANIIH